MLLWFRLGVLLETLPELAGLGAPMEPPSEDRSAVVVGRSMVPSGVGI